MRKSRFTEEQTIKVLKEYAAGILASDLCRKHGISDATFYKWRSRFGGMEISGTTAAVLQFCLFDNVWRTIATFCPTGILAYAFTRREPITMGISPDWTWI